MSPAGRPSALATPGAPEDTRARLLLAGLYLFAQQGYAKTSTRELAEAASVNVAAISYHFGDKAGLYRAVFTEPIGSPEAELAAFQAVAGHLRLALQAFFAGFIEPLRDGDMARLCMKLHFREMLEPTGLCDVTEALGIDAMHRALVEALRRHLGLAEADDELEALAICLSALGVHLHVGREITDRLNPRLHAAPDALDRWSERLLASGLAMVRAEAQRRGLPYREPD
jgi:TetR/AcrR family transcriptional regulator, regulator of cefoperazone and chloramphenicol sensitivity